MIKANTLEPFIEVDNALNKLKMDDLVQEILDDVGEYLILRGYITKADKDLLDKLGLSWAKLSSSWD